MACHIFSFLCKGALPEYPGGCKTFVTRSSCPGINLLCQGREAGSKNGRFVFLFYLDRCSGVFYRIPIMLRIFNPSPGYGDSAPLLKP
jgi:hypothetical protein